jgi:hypothetical protein
MAKHARRSRQSKAKKTSGRAGGRTTHAEKSRAKTTRAKTTRAKTNASKTTRAKTARGKTAHAKTTTGKWSQDVTEHSDALDLKKGVFTLKDPKKIAASLKASAEHSRRRKSGPYRSALSMLIFYMNRGGKNLPANRKRILQRAKRELRHQFGRA